jgi:hypothetical protein
MRPSVDMTRSPTPVVGVSTGENNTTGYSARHLIEESTMRTKALALITIFTGACVGDVGGGSAGRGRGNSTDDPKTGTVDCATVTDAAKIEKIERDVTIRATTDFAKLPTGCWDLYGRLRLEGASVTSLDKLGELRSVNMLEIVDTNLATFDSKQQIEVYGTVTVTGNAKLKDLDKVVADVWGTIVPATVTIRNNAELTSLGGLRYVKQVVGALQISDNPKLATVSLDELTQAGSIQVTGSAALTRFAAAALPKIGRVEVSNNALLTAIELGAAVDVGDLVIKNNAALASLGTWSSLANVKGGLTVDANPKLVDLGALGALRYVTSTVAITGNAALTSLGAMSHLQGIGSTVQVTGNAALTNCAGFEIDICVSSGTVTVNGNKQNTGPLNNCPLFWCEQQ